ncbi:hypothetical protein [Streptacidiphilus sp. EB103A]|uniref:hypothetical protein n=1 Tax=Streptacidiphilus sp. EB103A TaxID=3156275 RepID=UPI003513B4E9
MAISDEEKQLIDATRMEILRGIQAAAKSVNGAEGESAKAFADAYITLSGRGAPGRGAVPSASSRADPREG